MIGYITLGTNDLQNSAEFYDKLFDLMDAKRTFTQADFIVWGKNDGSAMFSIHIPHDKQQASVGNGVMIALKTESTAQVDNIYKKAIELGAINEGEPGYRMDGFYAAYFRDLEGNKLNVHFMETLN